MSDIFQEVDEAIKQDKAEAFWKENGPYIIGACILAVVLTALLTFYRGWQVTIDEEETTRFVELIETIDETNPVLDDLTQFATETNDDLGGLATLRAASIALRAGQTEDTIALLQQMIETKQGEKLYRHYALLVKTSLQANLKDADLNALAKELKPIATDRRNPFRFNARERRAVFFIQAKDFTQAKEELSLLTDDSKTPAAIKQRAKKMLHVLTIREEDQ